MNEWITVQTNEVYRYLGIHDDRVDPLMITLVEEAIEHVRPHLTPRYIAKELPLVSNSPYITIGTWSIESIDLARHLRGCDAVIVFAATLGSGLDRLLQRDMVSSPSLAVVEQAVAAAFMEAYADDCCEKLANPFQKIGCYFRSRFSPGYGDFSLDNQEQLLHILDANKHIGLSVTTSHMLTPMKSITAVIGISSHKNTCDNGGCVFCKKKDCLFRKEENCEKTD